MSGRIDFSMDFNSQRTGKKSVSTNGYSIYLLGNFSGNTDTAWQQRQITRINVDNFEQILAKIKPSVQIKNGVSLFFESLDDFHPDHWLTKLPVLADLQSLKKQLLNPNTVAEAAAKIQALSLGELNPQPITTPIQQETESQDDMLERLLGKAPEKTVTPTSTVDQLLKQIVAPHVQPLANPNQAVLVAGVDGLCSEFIRSILHDSNFQKLEALWLASCALINEENSDEQNFFLVDISQAELSEELAQGGHAFTQKLFEHMQSGDTEQDVLLISDYYFSVQTEDLGLLKFLSGLAASCQATFIAAAASALFTSESQQVWPKLLQEIDAEQVVLAYPRYLIRMPYGAKREPVESFVLEEAGVVPNTQELLWANPAFLCARLLVRTSGGQANNDAAYFQDIPAFSYPQDGEQRLQAGTETVLTEMQANALLANGFTPVIGFTQRKGVRLMPVTYLV
ncbi:type VI secretion system contractile sheath large subunit [Methylomonas sp. AM2-LC]|uniref:type VI secretion system contractile sheath domain-containing protein n=1 Tax=Methylomonas sp. AM2-LC TaxID=3153301 RepID=UPI0032641450